MLKYKNTLVIISFLLVTLFTTSFANADEKPAKDDLQASRQEIVQQYLSDLKKLDYYHIVTLFNGNGLVVSTSKGKNNARDFFYTFLPTVKKSNTELHKVFLGDTDPNALAARFHLKLRMKDGKQTEGEYMDEFVFEKNSNKLLAVYMFENLQFNESY